MKNAIIVYCISLVLVTGVIAQDTKNMRIPMLGEGCPKFTAASTQGKVNFPDDYYGKWKILFSHPADFTPVCTSEILELAYLQDDFESLKTKLLVISTDNLNSHIEWVKSMEAMEYKGRKKVKIKFPLISDNTLEISQKYGMISTSPNSKKDVRGVFIIDTDDRVRAIFFYPDDVGRNLEEIRRTLIALQETDGNKYLTPANWFPGQDVMLPSPQTVSEAEKRRAEKNPDLYELDWYIWFKKMK